MDAPQARRRGPSGCLLGCSLHTAAWKRVGGVVAIEHRTEPGERPLTCCALVRSSSVSPLKRGSVSHLPKRWPAGCYVVGFPGLGGREYFDSVVLSLLIEEGDVRALPPRRQRRS